MGLTMILLAKLEGLDGVEADVSSAGLEVNGDLDAVSEFLDDWNAAYRVEETGFTPDGTPRGMVVRDGDAG